jgi:hypothetical protein
MCAAIAGKTACQPFASFWKVCRVATSVDHPDDVTITTCCAFPTLASCWTSNGAGGAGVFEGDGAAIFVGVSVGVGVGVGVVLGVGVGVAAAGWANARELALPGLTALAGSEAGVVADPAGGLEVGAAIGWLLIAGARLPDADGWPAVHAESAHATATSQNPDARVVRCLPI